MTERRRLSLSMKYDILSQIESQSPTTTVTQMGEMMGVSRDTIRRIIKTSDKIRKDYVALYEFGNERSLKNSPPPRIKLTLAKKMELIQLIEAQPPDSTQTYLSDLLGVSRETIRQLIKKAEKIKEEWALCGGIPEPAPIKVKKVAPPKPKVTQRRKRVRLTLNKKYEVLQKIESQPRNHTLNQLAELTGVSKTSIKRIIRYSDEIREEWALQEGKPVPPSNLSRFRPKVVPFPEIDDALYQWFSLVAAHGEPINYLTLKKEAESLAKSMKIEDFEATKEWITRWSRRHEIPQKQAFLREQTMLLSGETSVSSYYSDSEMNEADYLDSSGMQEDEGDEEMDDDEEEELGSSGDEI